MLVITLSSNSIGVLKFEQTNNSKSQLSVKYIGVKGVLLYAVI